MSMDSTVMGKRKRAGSIAALACRHNALHLFQVYGTKAVPNSRRPTAGSVSRPAPPFQKDGGRERLRKGPGPGKFRQRTLFDHQFQGLLRGASQTVCDLEDRVESAPYRGYA